MILWSRYAISYPFFLFQIISKAQNKIYTFMFFQVNAECKTIDNDNEENNDANCNCQTNGYIIGRLKIILRSDFVGR